MSVELILLEDVQSLGKLGEQVVVADGYARNYLLPRKLAAPVTTETMRRLEAKKLRLQKEHEERRGVAQAMSEKISQQSVNLMVQAGEDNKLYGSVTASQIAASLQEMGVYDVQLRLHSDVETVVKVWVMQAK
jgi:large subunit ribosomal protein L9